MEQQAEAQEAKKPEPPKKEEKPETDVERYQRLKAKPPHKLSVKEKTFLQVYDERLEAERKRGALISKITDRAMAFHNKERVRITREITDKVAKVAPDTHKEVDKLRKERKAELDGVERERRKELKAVNKQYDESRAKIGKHWDEAITKANASIKDQMDQHEADLNESTAELKQLVDSFLDTVQILGDDQIEKLLDGETVALESGDSTEYIVLPGV